jgi:hypothetical protein
MAYAGRGLLKEAVRKEVAEVPAPTGVAIGDPIIFHLNFWEVADVTAAFENSVVIKGPTVVAGENRIKQFAVLHTGASVYDFTFAGTKEISGVSFGFTGRTSTLAQILASAPETGTGKTATAKALELAKAGYDLICLAAETTATAATPPEGMTERLDSGEGEVLAQHAATLDNVASGSTGTKAFTWTPSTSWAAILIAVPPVGGPPLPLAAAKGGAATSLALHAPTRLPLSPAAGSAATSLGLTAVTKATLPLSPAAGSAATGLVLATKPQLSLAAAGSAQTEMVLSTPAPPSVRRIERKPPLELDVEAETAEGDVFRLAADARLARNRPTGLSCSSERGEGFSTGNVTLFRDIFRAWPDLNLLDTWRMVGREGFVAYEGRVAGLPRQNSGGQSITLNLVGWMSYLKSRAVPMLIIDRRFSGWEEPTMRRLGQLLEAGYMVAGSASGASYFAGAVAPGLYFNLAGVGKPAAFPIGTELWFYAGGEDIGQLRFDFVGDGTTTWAESPGLCSDDIGSSVDLPVNYNGASAAHQVVQASASGRKFAMTQSFYTGTFVGTLTNAHSYRTPRVVGSHGIEPIGEWPEEGYPLTDCVEYMLATYFPKISLAPGSPRSSFPIQQFTGHDVERDGYESLQTFNNLILWETNVFEDRKLHMEPADLTKFDWWIDTTDPGTSVNFQGETTEDFANGITVHYTDFFGRSWTLWPSEHVELRDLNENNPANRHGEDLWTSKTVPWPCTEQEALQFGAAQLGEYNRPKRPGSFTVAGGYIRDAAGHLQQGYKMRNSQTLGIKNHPDEAAPRLITKPSWDPPTSTLTITVDAPPKTLEAIVARQALAREARNQS